MSLKFNRLVEYVSHLAKVLTFAFCGIVSFAQISLAQEITAIDFNGDLLGKVIPDGNVVSFDNRLIGNVTADSLIVNFEGDLIGGVIPQGIAIGNDTNLLGKVSNDGTVRLASGKIIGKVLPNGLVVNDYYDILGAVLFPGLVYDDDGKTIGRLTGDGSYTNLKGQPVGFISPDGYAYRRVGSDFLLDGRLISSKMVVSLNGSFLGSVVPGGEVSDFEGKVIGRIKANGFVYDEKNAIIGRIVKSAYAFDNFGSYLGLVTYNGEVINKGKLVGKYRADGKIINDKENVVGIAIDIAATASDLEGRYLGRIMPKGQISRARDISFQVGARGNIINSNGKIQGQIIETGPVFDYRASLIAHALSSAQVIALSGNPIGKIVHRQAFNQQGRILGATARPQLVINANNTYAGVTGINSKLNGTDVSKLVSPYGFVFSPDGNYGGQATDFAAIYNQIGARIASISLRGEVLSQGTTTLGRLTQSGLVVDERNLVLGKTIVDTYAVGPNGDIFGELAQNNLIIDKNKAVVAKITPDNAVIKTDKENSTELMPKAGTAFDKKIIIDFDGSHIGYADISGLVRNFDGTVIGRIVDNSYVLDNNNILSGYAIHTRIVVDDKCGMKGIITPKGDVRNFKDIYIGRILTNGQVVDETGNVIGHRVLPSGVIDYNGNLIGTLSGDGQLLNYGDEVLGCTDVRGLIRNKNGTIIARPVEYYPVIDFKDTVIGRTTIDGTVIGNDSQVLGSIQPDGNVNSRTGAPLGNLFKYAVAFDNENRYLGRVLADGNVENEKSEKLGKVSFDGTVLRGTQKVGYALYDFYAYDSDFKVLGIIGKNGVVKNFNNKVLGNLIRGFVVASDNSVIARGNRDFYIRDSANLILGELNLNGDVKNVDGNIVGKLGNAGQITDKNGAIIATAKPLQFYSQISTSTAQEVVVDENGNIIGYIDENGNVVDKNGKIIGKKDSSGNILDNMGKIVGKVLGRDNNKVYDENGKLIGYVNPDGSVVDEDGKVIGKLNEDGTVTNANNAIIGGIGGDWYERTEINRPKRPSGDPVISTSSGDQSKYRKSLNIALTPDGEYLGDIMDDGSVVDKNGKVIGQKTPDGLIIDGDGTLIGIEEIKKTQGGEIFVPAGTFGQGSAYGTGVGPGDNLGPGGGFGPGERYDPQRSAALAVAQGERRQNMQIGKISTNIRKEAFDGMQKDWGEQGVQKSISSWRVNMSEMILADKPIPAVLSRSIDSNNPTPVTAIVERNVYAEEGRNVLIPAGSRIIGEYGGASPVPETSSEATKISITWQRLIRPDGSIFVFDGLTADAQGRGGALGYMDKQLFKRYSMPVLTSILTNATAYMMAPAEEGGGENSSESPRQEAANDARQNFLDQMNQLFATILDDKANIAPMTYVPAGTRIIVFPAVDLWIRTLDNDKDEAYASQKGTVLVDDEARLREGGGGTTTSPNGGTGNVGSSGSQVSYESGSTAEPAAVPLIGEETMRAAQQQEPPKKRPVIVPPPPPSSRAPSSSGSGYKDGSSSGSSSNSSVPQLF